MYKKFIYLILFAFISLGLCGCDKPTSMILFNKYPITKENLLTNASEFVAGKRIYYIFISERPLQTDMVRIQVIKREEKANMALGKIVYSNDFRLSKDQVFYYTDYLVIHEAGYYCMAVYDRNDMERPFTVGDFRVTK